MSPIWTNRKLIEGMNRAGDKKKDSEGDSFYIRPIVAVVFLRWVSRFLGWHSK